MKQKLYILGFITALVTIAGVVYKLNHWPGAGVLITIGTTLLLFFFLPAAIINNYRSMSEGSNPWLHITGWLTCFFMFASMLFKVQHWPFSGVLLFIALPFPFVVFLPVYLWSTSKDKNFNIYNVIAVLSLLAYISVFSVLLALNVSKEKINDSFLLAVNYNKTGNAADQNSSNSTSNQVNARIDNVLNIISGYEELILKYDGLSRNQWISNPAVLWRPDSKGTSAEAIETNEGSPLAGKLEKGLENLINEMKSTPGYENLALAAPAIFDFNKAGDGQSDWASYVFREANQAWVLTYLAGLEANLRMIKIAP
jgi:hypothetical protein